MPQYSEHFQQRGPGLFKHMSDVSDMTCNFGGWHGWPMTNVSVVIWRTTPSVSGRSIGTCVSVASRRARHSTVTPFESRRDPLVVNFPISDPIRLASASGLSSQWLAPNPDVNISIPAPSAQAPTQPIAVAPAPLPWPAKQFGPRWTDNFIIYLGKKLCTWQKNQRQWFQTRNWSAEYWKMAPVWIEPKKW